MEQEIRKYVLKQWGFDENVTLSDRHEAEMKDIIEVVAHFNSLFVASIKAVMNDEMFDELSWKTREKVENALKF